MKILALADRPPRHSITGSLRELCESEDVELICTLGDLERADIIELEYITNIPKIGVYGNHCSGNYMEELGIMNMHLCTWQFGGKTFGGFQGCVRYKNGDAPMCTQEEATQYMQGFPPVDVFLSHAPPYGINDDPNEIAHQGFHALRRYLDTAQPRVWLHGHTYPEEGHVVTQHGPTRIEYVFGHKILEV